MELRGDAGFTIDSRRRRLLTQKAKPRGLLRVYLVIRADPYGNLAHRLSRAHCRGYGHVRFRFRFRFQGHSRDILIGRGGAEVGGRRFRRRYTGVDLQRLDALYLDSIVVISLADVFQVVRPGEEVRRADGRFETSGCHGFRAFFLVL